MKKQRNEFTCGPMGIYNALRVRGRSAEIKDLISSCNTDRSGSFRRDITNTTRKFFKVKHLKHPPRPWKGNQLYLVSVVDWVGDPHIILLVKSTDKMVYVANWYNQKGKFCHTWISWKTLRSVWDGYYKKII